MQDELSSRKPGDIISRNPRNPNTVQPPANREKRPEQKRGKSHRQQPRPEHAVRNVLVNLRGEKRVQGWLIIPDLRVEFMPFYP